MIRRTYTFDEVALVPQFNNIPSRTEPSLKSWLTRTLALDIPIIAANMDTVISASLAEELINKGSMPIYHRFTDFETQKAWVTHFQGRNIHLCRYASEHGDSFVAGNGSGWGMY